MENTITIPIMIAVVIGVAEAIKRATGINTRFIPILDIVLGIGVSYLYSLIEPTQMPQVVFNGFIIGLTACGLFSGGKNVVKGLQGE